MGALGVGPSLGPRGVPTLEMSTPVSRCRLFHVAASNYIVIESLPVQILSSPLTGKGKTLTGGGERMSRPYVEVWSAARPIVTFNHELLASSVTVCL